MKAICDKRDKLAIGAANVLKDYCEGNAVCRFCIFHKNGDCLLTRNEPDSWELEFAEKIVKSSEGGDDE